MGAHLVEPGSVLADRYVIEDLLAVEGDSHSWRARDKILARSVVLQILPSSSPYAADLVAAAKRASRVADTRILQVLDAVDDGELTYIVREWATGQSLNVLLNDGPLPARRTTWLMREVAAAMSNAHRMGLEHRRLAPDTVVITKSSGIKLIGLGTFAALRASPGEDVDPQRQDTTDIGRLLYACLTARWPGGKLAGLPAAPTEHGRLLRPRQVRAGVPRTLDVVCDRILGDPPRYGEPITSVDEIKESLSQILSEEGFTGVGNIGTVGLSAPTNPTAVVALEPPPALLPRDDGGPTTGDQPSYVVEPPLEPRSTLGRTVLWTSVAVLVLGAMLLAFLVGSHGGGSPSSDNTPTSSGGTAAASAQPIAIVGGQDFDPPPEGSGDENPSEVPLAFDGNAATSWETLTYFDPLSAVKPGVGLILDLGKSQDVSRVEVRLVGEPTDLELRAAPGDATSAPTGSVDDYQVVQSVTGAGTKATLNLDKPVKTQFLLVWLTNLPEEKPGSWKGRISEIKVFG